MKLGAGHQLRLAPVNQDSQYTLNQPRESFPDMLLAALLGIHPSLSGEIKVSTSTVAAFFSKMASTGQRIAIVDMVLLVFRHVHNESMISTVGVGW